MPSRLRSGLGSGWTGRHSLSLPFASTSGRGDPNLDRHVPIAAGWSGEATNHGHSLPQVPHDRERDQVRATHSAAGGVEGDPAAPGQVNLAPGVGRSRIRGANEGLCRIAEVARDEPGPARRANDPSHPSPSRARPSPANGLYARMLRRSRKRRSGPHWRCRTCVCHNLPRSWDNSAEVAAGRHTFAPRRSMEGRRLCWTGSAPMQAAAPGSAIPGKGPTPPVRASLAMRQTKISRLACRRMLRTAASTLTVRSSPLALATGSSRRVGPSRRPGPRYRRQHCHSAPPARGDWHCRRPPSSW